MAARMAVSDNTMVALLTCFTGLPVLPGFFYASFRRSISSCEKPVA